MCITAVGHFSSFVTAVGSNASSLGCWSWIYTSGGGKSTRIVVAYQPCNPGRRGTRVEMVWDQHLQYFEVRGEIRDPRSMFRLALVSLLHRWKAEGDEIVLMGDCNKNVYSGQIAGLLAGDDLHLHKMCHRTTGRCLPPTHTRGQVPIDAVYGTASLQCTAVTLLPGRAGVGNHHVFIVDIDLETILGSVFP